MEALRRFFGASRTDFLIFVALFVGTLVFSVPWAFVLVPIVNEQVINKYLLTFILLAISAIPMILGFVLPQLRSQNTIGAAMVRFGIALQLVGLAIAPIGLYFATDPQRSVPVAFASFTVFFIGIFVAGFGGNMVAPKRA